MRELIRKLFCFILSLIFILVVSFGNIIIVNGEGSTTTNKLTILPKDIKGSSSEVQITSWIKKGILTTYNDKSFRPKSNITRADFVTIVNKVFGFKDMTSINFSDVSSKDIYFNEIAKAISIGYMTGYGNGTFKPQNSLSRQDGAAIICKILKLEGMKNTKIISKIKDLQGVSDTSKAYISTAIENDFMKLYIGNLFKPSKALTREDAILLLTRAAGVVFNNQGSYDKADGSLVTAGNVTVNTSGVSIKNITISGNLYLTEGIAEGNIALDNVIVKGKTYIWGGGMNSITIRNSTLAQTVLYKKKGGIRVLATGSTRIGSVLLNSGSRLEEKDLSGAGFGGVSLEIKTGSEQNSSFVGNFDNININSSFVNVKLESGIVQNLVTSQKGTGASINLDNNSIISTILLNASANVTGGGKIQIADIRANGVAIAQKPDKVNLGNGIISNVGGSGTNVTLPTISSATLDLTTGNLIILGQNFKSILGINNDITAALITISDTAGGHSRTLTFTGNVDISGTSVVTLKLSSTDLIAIAGWAIQNGTSLNGKLYNISAAIGWNGQDAHADLINNPVTVSGNTSTQVTSATLDVASGILILTGSNFTSITGLSNDIVASKLTISDGSGGHSRTLGYTNNVEISSSTTAILVMNTNDLTAIAGWAVQNGTILNGYTYNLSAAVGWNGQSSQADLINNPVTVSGNTLTPLNSATLDITSGLLILTGSNFTSITGASNDIIASKLTISDGSGGHSRTLSYTNNVEISGSTIAILVINTSDLSAIASWAVQNGTNLNGYAYNISAVAGWNGPNSTADLYNNPVTISGSVAQILGSATLDISSGLLILTGSNFAPITGLSNDIIAAKLTISDGSGGHSRTLSYTNNVEISSSTTAILSINTNDLSAISGWAVQNGTILNGYAYNISAVAGWNGPNSTADLYSNPVTISGSMGPSLISASLDLPTGRLILSGSNFTSITGASNDITALKFTISDGAGGHSRSLSYSSNVEISSSAIAILMLNANDLAAISGWAIQNGTILNGYAYNIAVAAGWNGPNSQADLTGNPLTVSGNALPTLINASYNVASGLLILTGNNLISVIGSNNDIITSKLIISDGAVGHTRTLSTTANIDVAGSNLAIISVSGADLTAISAWATQNGNSLNGNAYNIAALAGWNGPESIADLTGNPILVSGNAQAEITSATFSKSTGRLVLTGNNFVSVSGTSNDIIASKITISDGSGGHAKTLTSATANVEITGTTSATLMVAGADLTAIAAWATQNGVTVNGNAYNISAASGWNGVNSGEDLALNPITVSGNPLPVLISASLDISTGTFFLTGSNLIAVSGLNNDITALKLTISDGTSGHSRTLTVSTSDVDILNSVSATLNITGADLTAIAAWATQNGNSLNGRAYNIAAAAGWNGIDSTADIAGNPITVSGISVPLLQSVVRDSDTQLTVTINKPVLPVSSTKSNDGGFALFDAQSPSTKFIVSRIAPGSTSDKVVLTVANIGNCANLKLTYTAGGNGTVADEGGNLLATNLVGLAVVNGLAPDLGSLPVLTANGIAGQSVISLAALASGSGHNYKYFISSDTNPVSIPLIGFNAAAWTTISNGNAINIGNGKNIGIVEVDSNNLVLRFKNVVAVADISAMSLAHGVIFSAGSSSGKTLITLGAPSVAGNTFRYIVSTDNNPIATPIVGFDASSWISVLSGAEIVAGNNSYIGVVEVDNVGHVVRFTCATAVTTD